MLLRMITRKIGCQGKPNVLTKPTVHFGIVIDFCLMSSFWVKTMTLQNSVYDTYFRQRKTWKCTHILSIQNWMTLNGQNSIYFCIAIKVYWGCFIFVWAYKYFFLWESDSCIYRVPIIMCDESRSISQIYGWYNFCYEQRGCKDHYVIGQIWLSYFFSGGLKKGHIHISIFSQLINDQQTQFPQPKEF